MQNIVATFDDPNSAQLAVGRLEDAGIHRGRIHVDPSLDTQFRQHAGPSQPRPGQAGYRKQSVLESIGGFFANLVESHTDESGIYSEALRRGTTLLLIEAERHEVEHVVLLLQESGAVTLEKRVGQWRAQGWEPAPQAAGTVAASAAGTQAAAPTGTDAVASTAKAGGASAGATTRGRPIGTHSFTGGGVTVGMPSAADMKRGGAGTGEPGPDREPGRER